MNVLCAFFVVVVGVTLFVRLPDLLVRPRELPRALGRIALTVPDVFNTRDLRMSDHWPVVYRDSGGTWSLVPFHAPDGRKLLYPRLFDLLYGNSMRWRRLALEQDVTEFSVPNGKGFELVQRVVAFDDRVRGRRGGKYRVEIFRASGTDAQRADAEKYAPQLVYSYEVERRGAQ